MSISPHLMASLSPAGAPLLFEPPAGCGLREKALQLPPLLSEIVRRVPDMQNAFYMTHMRDSPPPAIDDGDLLAFYKLVREGNVRRISKIPPQIRDRLFEISFFACRLARLTPRNIYLGYAEGRDHNNQPNTTYLRYLGVLPSADTPIVGSVTLYAGYGQGLHGWLLFALPLVKAGCAVFSYDDIGIGLSSPRSIELTGLNAGPVNLNNTAAFNRWVQKIGETHEALRDKPRLGIAHCMGGTHLLPDVIRTGNAYGFGALWFINPIWCHTTVGEEFHQDVVRNGVEAVIQKVHKAGNLVPINTDRPPFTDPDTEFYSRFEEQHLNGQVNLVNTLAYKLYFREFRNDLPRARVTLPTVQLYLDPHEPLAQRSQTVFDTDIRKPNDLLYTIDGHYGPFMGSVTERASAAHTVRLALESLFSRI